MCPELTCNVRTSNCQQTCLHLATFGGHVDCSRWLLDSGADPHCKVLLLPQFTQLMQEIAECLVVSLPVTTLFANKRMQTPFSSFSVRCLLRSTLLTRVVCLVFLTELSVSAFL